MTDTASRLAQAFATALDLSPTRFTPDTTFAGDLRLDSLDAIRLAMETEDEFLIEMPDDCWADVKTFGEAVAVVERVLARQADEVAL